MAERGRGGVAWVGRCVAWLLLARAYLRAQHGLSSFIGGWTHRE